MNRTRKIIFCIIAALMCSMSPTTLVNGEGEQQIKITSAVGFIEFAANCQSADYSVGKTFALTNSINITGSAFSGVPSFSGTFDGGGNTITYSLERSGENVGLFLLLTESGIIKNLDVHASILSVKTGGKNVGIIVGNASGNIENCTTSGTIIAGQNVGGVVGIAQKTATISNSTNNAIVTATSEAGGIAGLSLGIITACKNLSPINTAFTGSMATNIGGICGSSQGSIAHCTNKADVGKYEYTTSVGGIVGSSSGSTATSQNLGNIYGSENVAGIVGVTLQSALVTIELCENRGGITGQKNVAGILGKHINTTLKCDILSCVSSGKISAKTDNVGGVVGLGASSMTIADCVSFSDVTAKNGSNVGGIGGIVAGKISSCASLKNTLSAQHTVGGIVASGNDVSKTISASSVKDAAYFVGMTAGTISGTATQNYFLSNTIGGIDGINYIGKSEPTDITDLTNNGLSGITEDDWIFAERSFPCPKTVAEFSSELVPELFSNLPLELSTKYVVKFVADGDVIKTIEVQYGQSVNSEDIPIVPEKNGYYGIWDGNASAVKADTIITAEYKKMISSITPNGDLPILIEGSFLPSDSGSAVALQSFALGDSVQNYTVHAAYSLSLTKGGEITVRTMCDEIKNPIIAYNYNGEVKTTTCHRIKSYLVFTLPAACDFAILEQGFTIGDIWWVWLILGIATLSSCITILITKYKKKKRKTQDSAAIDSENKK